MILRRWLGCGSVMYGCGACLRPCLRAAWTGTAQGDSAAACHGRRQAPQPYKTLPFKPPTQNHVSRPQCGRYDGLTPRLGHRQPFRMPPYRSQANKASDTLENSPHEARQSLHDRRRAAARLKKPPKRHHRYHEREHASPGPMTADDSD